MSQLKEQIRGYWNGHIHDLAIVKHPIGTLGFFDDLDEYRFDKLNYLPRLVDFSAFDGKSVLEIGCGAGTDLVRFAKGGARVSGIDLSEQAIDLARRNFSLRNLTGEFQRMDGEQMDFPDNHFDVVYAHGVLQYTADPHQMAREMKRVLKPGGLAISMVYNRYSWLAAMSALMKVGLEHQDAPVIRRYSISEFKNILGMFPKVRTVVERFPVKTRLHKGIKGTLYNTVFVGGFNALPRSLVRRFGWHIMGFATK